MGHGGGKCCTSDGDFQAPPGEDKDHWSPPMHHSFEEMEDVLLLGKNQMEMQEEAKAEPRPEPRIEQKLVEQRADPPLELRRSSLASAPSARSSLRSTRTSLILAQMADRSACAIGGADRPSAVSWQSLGKAGRVSFSANAHESIEEVSCLAWVVCEPAQVEEAQLELFHAHLAEVVRLLESEVLISEAIFGLIRGYPMQNHHMTAADVTVRLGQLLCRKAATLELPIKVGVHNGGLQQKSFGWFGRASTEAMRLSTMASHCQVLMSKTVKDQLSAFRLAHLVISPQHDSYALDASSRLGNYFQQGMRPLAAKPSPVSEKPRRRSMVLNSSDTKSSPSSVTTPDMSLQAFEELLDKFNVDTSNFGMGVASTLAEFHEAVVKDRKSDLVVHGGRLVRVVNLLRVAVRMRDSENKLRELRVVSEPASNGNQIQRNAPLAVTLSLPEKSKWQEAALRQEALLELERCFEHKLGLSVAVQQACLSIDMESYKYQEEVFNSERVPGMPTTYRSYNININVKDRNHQDLKCIGLPQASSFSTGEGENERAWMWAQVGNNQESELMDLLQTHGIDASDLEPQAFAELQDEVFNRNLCVLEAVDGVLLRTLRVIKVWLHAQVMNVDHVLVVKAKWQKGRIHAGDKDRPISMRMKTDQNWEDAVGQALSSRLGLSPTFQANHLSIDMRSHVFSEEVGYSRSYPGLRTVYAVNEVSVYVHDCQEKHGVIGLPGGHDFASVRKEILKGPEFDEDVVTHWRWRVKEEHMKQQHDLLMKANLSFADLPGNMSQEDAYHVGTVPSGHAMCELSMFGNRVPAPPALQEDLHEESFSFPTVSKEKAPGYSLKALMSGKKTNWDRARNAMVKIRTPSYSIRDFFGDLVSAFPELGLYCAQEEKELEARSRAAVAAALETGTSSERVTTTHTHFTNSGRTADDEYQRTIAALFTIYWIMRIDMDGKEGFCFGLNKLWQPRTAAQGAGRDADVEGKEEFQRRLSFYESMDWESIKQLLLDAGLLIEVDNRLRHDEGRTLAMLVLMAIHDIMKNAMLCPTVDKKVKEFAGYSAGELVSDHDSALGYVLTYTPELLPSFSGLPKAEQESIKFTHCKLDYNMGWLVQAEAPPGALFRTFRQVVTAGKARERDIAFHFVHWFADLAGAEPSPLAGSEKFVLRFPLKVLRRFMESFCVVQKLSPSKTETQVLEDYLKWCWTKHQPCLGDSPEGEGAVAKMRLILMAQGNSDLLLEHFQALPADDRVVLSEEMALTGLRHQFYLCEGSLRSRESQGPAILVYYSPALLQKAGKDDPGNALAVLAEVYRQARELWPLSEAQADSTVTVRIDQLKELDAFHIFNPEALHVWVVSRTSAKDAVVRLQPVSTFRRLDWDNHQGLTFTKQSKKSTARLSAKSVLNLRFPSSTWSSVISRSRSRNGAKGIYSDSVFKRIRDRVSPSRKTTGGKSAMDEDAQGVLHRPMDKVTST